MAFTRIRGESRAESDMDWQQQESRRARRRSACVCLRAGGEETNKKDATCDMGGWCGPSVRKLCLLKAPRLSEAMCRRKECRGACGGSLNGGDRSGEAQLRELGHTCPDELSRAAAVSGNRSLIYICGSVCLYRFS